MTQEVKMLLGIGIATLLVIVGAVFFLSSGSPASETTPEQIAENNEYLIRENSTKMGSESASVTIVEFADFQCPACGAAHPALKQALSEYQDQVQFVYRHFPLVIHKNAKLAAYSAEAAGLQGKFWEMHDLLFENQNDWSESTSPMDIFTEYATELELDTAKFAEDVKSDTIKEKVDNDQRDGTLVGVNATPTIFINGKPSFRGAPNYNDLKAAIDAELASSTSSE